MSNCSNARVNAFLVKFPKGDKLLKILNQADPLHCFYGDDVNPDEYIGAATRFLESDSADVFVRLQEAFPYLVDFVVPPGGDIYDEWEVAHDRGCICYECDPPPFSHDDILLLKELITS